MPSEPAEPSNGAGFEPELRLHPSSWLFGAANYLKHFIVPVVAAAFVGARDGGWWVPALLVVPLVAAALWHQWIYRYGFSPRGLAIHDGLFFRNIRTIDYARIENVDTERGLLHRLLGVAVVRVETSTGGSAEAQIRVLDQTAVDAMRAQIFARRAQIRGRQPGGTAEAPSDAATTDAATTNVETVAATADQAGAGTTTETAAAAETADAAPEETLLPLRPPELVRFGLIDNRGMLVVAALLGVLGQGGFFERLAESAEPLRNALPWDDVFGASRLTMSLLAVSTAVGLVAATRVLSILLAFLTLYDFRLTRKHKDLCTRYGLLTRISRTLRRPRIQAVHQTATLLHRLFRRVSLRVDLAGGAGAAAGAQQQGQNPWRESWLAPLCPAQDAARLIRSALPQARLQDPDWRGLAPRARGRIFRITCWLWLLIAAWPAIWVAGYWAPAILVAPLPLFWLRASLYVKYTGWAVHQEFFVLRRGWLTRRVSVAPRNRIQSVGVSESPFDRRYGMAALSVDHAGASNPSRRFALRYMNRDDARALAAELYRSRLTPGAPASR